MIVPVGVLSERLIPSLIGTSDSKNFSFFINRTAMIGRVDKEGFVSLSKKELISNVNTFCLKNSHSDLKNQPKV